MNLISRPRFMQPAQSQETDRCENLVCSEKLSGHVAIVCNAVNRTHLSFMATMPVSCEDFTFQTVQICVEFALQL